MLSIHSRYSSPADQLRFASAPSLSPASASMHSSTPDLGRTTRSTSAFGIRGCDTVQHDTILENGFGRHVMANGILASVAVLEIRATRSSQSSLASCADRGAAGIPLRRSTSI